jgi:hypothetical protein
MIRIERIVVLLLISIIPHLAFSWGKTGHRVVGQIAMNHMSKKALKNVQSVLGNEDVAIVANWMDYVKSEQDKRYMNPWHYCTIHQGEEYAGAPEEGDAIQKIHQFIDELKTKNFTVDEQFALKSLIHLVGDIHQPLHVGNGEDKGGNDVKVTFFGDKSNLHRVWDSDMIDFEQLSYQEYAQWVDVASKEQIEVWQNDSVLVWTNEGVAMRESVYAIPEDSKLSYLYVHDHIYEVNERLLKAGIRLAGILNEIYGK